MKLAILSALCIASLGAQEFEVVSIRPSAPATSRRILVDFEGGPGTGDPTRFSCRNCSLALLVMHAYGVDFDQIAGIDSRTDLYDIEAKVPAGATNDQFHGMLQGLLSRRFHVSLHGETKQMRAYELVVGKGGAKMKESVTVEVAGKAPEPVLDDEGFPVLAKGRSGYSSINGRAHMQLVNSTMDQLASKLSNQLDVPVINATGLAGKHDYDLHWDGTEDGRPNLFSAIESQLGLRLQAKKTAVMMVVIDHADPGPTEN